MFYGEIWLIILVTPSYPEHITPSSQLKLMYSLKRVSEIFFLGVFVSSCVSNEKQTHPQKYL